MSEEPPPVSTHPPHSDPAKTETDGARETPSHDSSTTVHDFETHKDHVNPSEADSEELGRRDALQADAAAGADDGGPDVDLDPIVLSSLVTQLKQSLDSVQQQRDDLLQRVSILTTSLDATQSSLSELEQQHVYVSAAKEAVETELKSERSKREAAEESVDLLRSRLEEARKAVAGLQGQDRRKTTLGYGTVPALGLDSGQVEDLVSTDATEDRRNKRTSVMGLPGMGAGGQSFKAHRRTSSQSEPGFESVSFAVNSPSPAMLGSKPSTASLVTPRTNTGGLRELRLGVTNPAPSPGVPGPPSPNPSINNGLLDPSGEPSGGAAGSRDSRRWSALSVLRSSPRQPPTPIDDVEELDDSPARNRTSRPGYETRLSSSSSSLQDKLNALTGGAAEPTDGSRETIIALQSELSRLRGQLAESQEARVASENAVKVLREFMSASGGADGVARDGEGHGDGDDTMASPIAGLRLPPLPTDIQADDDEDGSFMSTGHNTTAAAPSAAKAPSSWTLRLWKDKPQPASSPPEHPASTSPQSCANPESTPQPAAPLAGFVSSWTKGVSSPSPTKTGSAHGSTADHQSLQPSTSSRMLSFFGKVPAQAVQSTPPPPLPPRRSEDGASPQPWLSTRHSEDGPPPPLPPRKSEEDATPSMDEAKMTSSRNQDESVIDLSDVPLTEHQEAKAT